MLLGDARKHELGHAEHDDDHDDSEHGKTAHLKRI
jgi:hypothetical protein